MKILLGDWFAIVGKDNMKNVTGLYWLGKQD